jgi:fatty-acyl-CoA synthase
MLHPRPTGDMGCLAADQLYLFGRKNDLIIIGGKNIYPQDLEAIANQVPGIYPGRAVALGLPDEKLGSEAIVMVCEVERPNGNKAQIERDLRRRMVQQADVTLSDVRLVDERWIIKPSSGKSPAGITEPSLYGSSVL